MKAHTNQILPPLSPQQRQSLVNAIADARKLKIDLEAAQSAGLDVRQLLDECTRAIADAQAIHDKYFALPPY